MKKIILITQSYAPERGACPERLAAMVTGLRARGMDVDVVTALPNYPFGKVYRGYRGKWRVKDTVDGVTVRRYFIIPSNSLKIFPRLISLFSFFIGLICSIPYLIRRKPDYILVQTPPFSVALFGFFISKILGVKMILNISDVWPLALQHLKGMKRGVGLRMLERLERRLYRSAALCIGQSEEIAAHVQRVSDAKCIVYKTGTEYLELPIGLSPRKSSEPFKIVYAGLLGAAQGLTNLCRQIDFSKLGAELHVFGDGGDRKALEKFIKDHPERQIFWHGCFSQDFIREILPYHHAALVPMSTYVKGNLPSKIYEASAAGLPILFHGSGEGAYLINKYKIGLVSDLHTSVQLKENILKLRDLSSEEAAEFRKRCRKVAFTEFDRTKELDRLYAELIELEEEEVKRDLRPESKAWKIYSLRPKKFPS